MAWDRVNEAGTALSDHPTLAVDLNWSPPVADGKVLTE